jgi:hypothetical protein
LVFSLPHQKSFTKVAYFLFLPLIQSTDCKHLPNQPFLVSQCVMQLCTSRQLISLYSSARVHRESKMVMVTGDRNPELTRLISMDCRGVSLWLYLPQRFFHHVSRDSHTTWPLSQESLQLQCR